MSEVTRLPLHLLMARHGQTEDNIAGRLTGWGDPRLTPLGKLQAAQLAAHLATNYSLARIYTSPLSRALETASIIAHRVGLAPVVIDGLKEIHFGECEGLTDDEFGLRYPLLAVAARDGENLDFVWPGGESRRGFYQRVREAILGIAEKPGGSPALVVGHGGALAYFMAEILDGQPDRWRRYLPENCALAELVLAGEQRKVVRQNYVAHLLRISAS